MDTYKLIFKMEFMDNTSTWNKIIGTLPNSPKEVMELEHIVSLNVKPTKEIIKHLEEEIPKTKLKDGSKVLSYKYLRTEVELDDK